MRTIAACAAFAFLVASSAEAALCPAWTSPAQIVAKLDAKLITEASGVAPSKRYPNRFYHNNDSGDGPYFYVSDASGATQRVAVTNGFKDDKPLDVEDIALGACGGDACLYLGDIGDNAETRETISFVLIKERAKFGEKVRALRTITAKYPDKPHNAEGFALHPNGDLYVLTKSFIQPDRRGLPAQLFRLTAAQLKNSKAVQTFEEVGVIDLPWLLYDYGLLGQIVTAFDIAPDGTTALALTYQNVFEFKFDPAKKVADTRKWVAGTDYRVTALNPRPRFAEAVAYAPDGKSFYYDSELTPGVTEVPLYQVRCTP